MISIFSCKKITKDEELTSSTLIESPLVKVDKNFPNGILQFNSNESAAAFFKKAASNPEVINVILTNFTSFRKVVKDYEASNFNEAHHIQSNNSYATNNNFIEVTDTAEFINDMNLSIVEDPTLQSLLNSNLQILVNSKLYQMSKVGNFEVTAESIPAFLEFMQTHYNSIMFDTSFHKIPGEVPIGDNKFQVAPGIIVARPMPAAPVDPCTDPWGCQTGGGGTTYTPPCSIFLPTNFQYETNTTGTGGNAFNNESCIYFDDRRFVFKTQNINLVWYHQVDLKAKLQRKKKFFGIPYWGPSFADEIITGFDNAYIETSYIAPYPQQFSSIYRPTVANFANFQVGDQILNAMNINVNINALGYAQLSNSQISSFIDGQLNNFVGGVYTNVWKNIENKIVTSIDASYLTSYAAYTKRVTDLDNLNRLKFRFGQGERPQGYSHENTWSLDWNIGAAYNAPNPTYTYNLVRGSFYGRARVGCYWYGIRTIAL